MKWSSNFHFTLLSKLPAEMLNWALYQSTLTMNIISLIARFYMYNVQFCFSPEITFALKMPDLFKMDTIELLYVFLD